MKAWLSLIGIGEDGVAGLSERARARLEQAEILVGDERVLALVPREDCLRWRWPRPLDSLFADIAAQRGRRVCILASGDPLHYGVGALASSFFTAEEMEIFPHLSAFTLACARLRWDRAVVETLSLHHAPVAILNRVLSPGAKIVALTRDGSTPALVAAFLVRHGWGKSRVWVLERLGGPHERIVSFCADAGEETIFHDLHVLAIDCVAGAAAQPLPFASGLPDEAFEHDGMLTKREVRAVVLAILSPTPGRILWDVGAGCGSVALEWLRAAPRTQAFAVERDARRSARIRRNAETLGVPGVVVVEGEAPGALADLPPPDAVFVGGGVSRPGVLDACWTALKPGGILLANTVSLEGERMLLTQHAEKGGGLSRIAVTRLAPLGTMTGWKPLAPVMQWSIKKP